jgi:hypothetical protein
MRWSDLPFTPSPGTLRWFAAFTSLFLAALAGREVLVAGSRTAAGIGFGLALLVLVVGLLRPMVVRPVFVGSLVLLYPINWLMSHLLLGCVFYCVFTPLALFFKLIGRDALGRTLRREQDSYWTDKPAAPDTARYFRPF